MRLFHQIVIFIGGIISYLISKVKKRNKYNNIDNVGLTRRLISLEEQYT